MITDLHNTIYNIIINPETKKKFDLSEFHNTGNFLNMMPNSTLSNEIISDYIEHYKSDAERFDYFNEVYGDDTLEDFRRLRQYIYKLIPRDAKITLDVGSGNAWLAAEHLKNKRYIISMDVAENNIKKAVEKYNSEFHFGVVGDALQPPFQENSIDCIVSSEVIEHIDNPAGFINGLLKILKKGGKLIISTPYKEKIRYETCIHCNKNTPRNAHLHSFDEIKLKNMATEQISDFSHFVFGNKALLIMQFHKISKYFGFNLWRFADRIANGIIDKKAHIIAVYTK